MLSCRDMAQQLNIYWIGIEMVGRAGFKSFGFTLRAEPATSLSRYGLTIEYLLNWNWMLRLDLRWWVVQDLNPSDLPYGLNLQPAYRGMA
nr:hypothetical protein [Providencia rettgeri]